jgi:hypothetical protein
MELDSRLSLNSVSDAGEQASVSLRDSQCEAGKRESDGFTGKAQYKMHDQVGRAFKCVPVGIAGHG